mgnify:CR=1 FL=1
MKLSNKYIAFASVALLMASCDLDKFPEGDYISEAVSYTHLTLPTILRV